MKLRLAFFLVGFMLLSHQEAAPHLVIAQGEETCYQNTDCGKAVYCQKSRGDCNGEGRCQERAVLCGAELGSVCGCDGYAYGSLCFAASAGMNVAHDGTREVKPSTSP